MDKLKLLEHTDTVNELLARYGVKFGIYKNNTFHEQLFPFDAIPRVIEADEFDFLERGLKQRVVALNMFLKDIYSKKQIVKDGVIPEDFMFKEEFEILKYMATKYPDECRIFLYEPVSITTISLCEQRMGVKFTDELKALYTFTNGMDFSLCTLGFDFLESIERMHEIGYFDYIV